VLVDFQHKTTVCGETNNTKQKVKKQQRPKKAKAVHVQLSENSVDGKESATSRF
jgi:hypothetical protein